MVRLRAAAAIAAVLKRAGEAEPEANRPGPDAGGAGPGRRLGQRLRALRQQRNLSLPQAASQAGISRSALGLIERTSQGASPAIIRALAEMYGLTVSELTASLADTGPTVVRGSQARVLPTMGPGLSVTQLSSIPNAVMVCQIWAIQPGAGRQGSYTHKGEEFIYVLAGTFEIMQEGVETHVLAQGDSLYFESMRPHTWCNPGSEETRVLLVNTPRPTEAHAP